MLGVHPAAADTLQAAERNLRKRNVTESVITSRAPKKSLRLSEKEERRNSQPKDVESETETQTETETEDEDGFDPDETSSEEWVG